MQYDGDVAYDPPFFMALVQGSRVLDRWESYITSCKINYLYPEPDIESSDQDSYSILGLQKKEERHPLLEWEEIR